MIEAFQAFIAKENLLTSRDKTLLAVSGGVDSVVMSYLFKQLGFPFAIAHCNFQLRAEASNQDADFVRQLANNLGVTYHEICFETEIYAQQNKLSIQVAARNLRYNWFQSLLSLHQYTKIATAHHLNDSLETVLYNLTKGCGIRGLHGILPKKTVLIRPLLFATKSEITDFATDNNLAFREDASNAIDKYARNKIRQHVVPVLQKINPALENTFSANIQHFRDTEALQNWAIAYWKKQLLETTANGHYRIAIKNLAEVPACATVLYEILQPFGFNGRQIAQAIENQTHQSGRLFFTPSHRLLIDRDFWWIEPLENVQNQADLTVEKLAHSVLLPDGASVQMSVLATLPSEKNEKDTVAFFDADGLQFPITFRKWQQGDVFQPFGMNGRHKKVSAVLKNKKISVFEKEKIWLMESGGKIAWVVGIRAAEEFRIKADSGSVIRMAFFSQ